jgi:hypothetical protein
MTLAQASGFVLICLMIWLIYATTRFVSQARFNGKGIYFITINAWFRKNKLYQAWLRQNKGYHYCIVVVISLCATVLVLIEPFRHNKMFMRPEETLFISALLWWSILKKDQWLYKKVGKNN